MREDIVDVTLLIALMRAHLPISASLERWVLEDLATNDPALGPELSMSRQIIDVSYLGDFGGIACKLDIDARTPTGKRKGENPSTPH